MVTSQSRQNHCLVHPPRLRPNPLTTPCLCWCCRSASTCPGRSNLWYQVLRDQKPRPRKNTFSSSSLGWPPSPTPLYNGISRSLEGECGMGGFAELSWTFSFWKCIKETGKTCARVVCVLGWWWWRRDWCPLQPPSTSSYGGCFLPPERNDLQVGLFQCVLSKITGFGFHLLLEISQQDNMISLDICQRGGRSKRLLWESRHWRS